MMHTLKLDDMESCEVEEDANFKSSYNLKIISNMAQFYKVSNDVYLHISPDMPFQLNYNLDDEITIFPNPSAGTFRVMTNIENYSFKIFDSFGKIILSKQNLSRSTKVDLTAHKKGIYQIIFECNDKLRNFKLVNL